MGAVGFPTVDVTSTVIVFAVDTPAELVQVSVNVFFAEIVTFSDPPFPPPATVLDPDQSPLAVQETTFDI